MVAVESFLRRVFFNCLFPSDDIEKLNMMVVSTPGGWAWRDRRYIAHKNADVTLLVGQRLIGESSQPRGARELELDDVQNGGK